MAATKSGSSTALATRNEGALALPQQTANELAERKQLYLDKARKYLDDATGELAITIAQARAMELIRTQVIDDEMVKDMRQLQGSPLGFKTDKTYGDDDLRTALTQALLLGFRIVGNEFNIIAGNFYAAQAGLDRLVREWPGISDIRLRPGVPQVMDKGALVPFVASWRLNGTPDSIVCTQKADGEMDERIPVRLNNGQGADAAVGKAKRKMLARMLERLSSGAITPPTEDDILDVEPSVEGPE